MQISIIEAATVAVPMVTIGGGMLWAAIKFGHIQKDIESLRRDSDITNERVTKRESEIEHLEKSMDNKFDKMYNKLDEMSTCMNSIRTDVEILKEKGDQK